MVRVSELYTLVAEDRTVMEAKPKSDVTTVRIDKEVHDILKKQARAKGVTLQSHVKQVLRQ